MYGFYLIKKFHTKTTAEALARKISLHIIALVQRLVALVCHEGVKARHDVHAHLERNIQRVVNLFIR